MNFCGLNPFETLFAATSSSRQIGLHGLSSSCQTRILSLDFGSSKFASLKEQEQLADLTTVDENEQLLSDRELSLSLGLQIDETPA